MRPEFFEDFSNMLWVTVLHALPVSQPGHDKPSRHDVILKEGSDRALHSCMDAADA